MISNKLKKIFLSVALLLSCCAASAETFKGTVIDKATGEPLIGAAVVVKGSTKGTATDLDGNFSINVAANPKAVFEVSFISYISQEVVVNLSTNVSNFTIELVPDSQMLSQVVVATRKNLEGETVLQKERLASNVAIENMGAKEMALKGISNVQEGVKKITGISVASAGQLVVRGLGDRYSITTLNGQPIASPNPDNKLIPLNIFPSSTVKNITVSKVYDATSYADYSGAHIDIATKDLTSDDFFTVGLSVGGNFNTVGRDFYSMDNVSLFSKSTINPEAFNLKKDFDDIMAQGDVFDTTFDVNKTTALPVFSSNLAWGHSYDVGRQKLSMLLSAGLSNDQKSDLGSEYRIYEASGDITDEYTSDNYESELKMATLANVSMTMREQDRVSYTFFYARNASEKFSLRSGYDQEDQQLVGTNNVTRIYSLMTHQLHGTHSLADAWDLNWDGAYTSTSSEEPDRRQVMYQRLGNDPQSSKLTFFDLNAQETMRYFGDLEESEWNANIYTDYKFGEAHKLTFGGAYRSKVRDYYGSRFYYDIEPFHNSNGNPTSFEDPYQGGALLNQEALENGSYSVDRRLQKRDSYDSGSDIVSGYVSTDLSFEEKLLINLGVRYEQSTQYVNYNDGNKDGRSVLPENDLFPALNVKYNLTKDHQVRFAASRTVTRPSFIEMAPFLYQESYGSAQLMGNGDLKNGYNYNVDLRYEALLSDGDMVSVAGYYKFLDSPIERTQSKSGGGEVHTFNNAESGLAAGAEFELRKKIVGDLRLGVNASFMYTNVSLSDGGSYTNKDRALQGASPYLVNADLTYAPMIGGDKQLSLALLYNLQGPRIHTVGTATRGDIIQTDVHTLNFTSSYKITSKVELKMQLSNLLNRADVYEQEINGQVMEVERHQYGMGGDIGVSLKF